MIPYQSKVRVALLNDIILSREIYQRKYTMAYNSLKAVVELENKETKEKLSKEYFDKFKAITNLMNNLHEKIPGLPLAVLEQYFFRKSKNLNAYVYIDYQGITTNDLKAIEIYQILEDFFQHIYLLAVEIADHYSLDIKMKPVSKGGTEETI